jgi:hypothetical protein
MADGAAHEITTDMVMVNSDAIDWPTVSLAPGVSDLIRAGPGGGP